MKNNEIPLLPDSIYHIYSHANGKENLFSNTGNYHFFLKRYIYFIEPIAETYAYCLMPNHVHFMVGIKSEVSLQEANKRFQLAKNILPGNIKPLNEKEISLFISKTFGNFFSSYTQSFNKQQDRRGSLFIPNFKRKIIVDEQYYAKLIFYIHNNPVHHGFVKSMSDGPYSSYHSYLSDKKTWVAKDKILEWLGSVNEFKRFHDTEKPGMNFEI
jgi:REP element-mobilizing transposase RayT